MEGPDGFLRRRLVARLLNSWPHLAFRGITGLGKAFVEAAGRHYYARGPKARTLPEVAAANAKIKSRSWLLEKSIIPLGRWHSMPRARRAAQ
jgi:hypothetical protein